jgi:diguanylate cyclase (GGDEF)-like protein
MGEALQQKVQFFGDYAVFLKALLPQATAICCHDKAGHIFWRDEESPAGLDSASHRQAVAQLLESPNRAGKLGPLSLDGSAAYLFPLLGERREVLTVLTAVVDSSAGILPYEFCAELLRPALRSLRRELSLRFRLTENYRKLSVQTAEENLLHQVESLTQERQTCESSLSKILNLCREHIKVGKAILIIPGRSIRLIDSDGDESSMEVDLWLDDVMERVSTLAAPGVNGGHKQFLETENDSDLICLPINHGGDKVIGFLALADWGQSAFSQARRRRILRYVASHIESVMDANYDSLTGLTSWGVFEGELIDACGGVGSENHTVMYLDVDQLHVTNDTFGRDVGDEILTAFARLIREHLDGHLTTRIDSDSFAGLLRDTDVNRARELAEKICNEFSETEFTRGGQVCRASVSVGIGPLSGDPVTGSAALSTAQVACQAAKDRGRNRVEIYQSEDASIIQRFDDIHQVGQIRNAIDEDRLVLMGQPIAALKEGIDTQYFEVLVRLLDEEGRAVPPSEFFSAAERYQLMEELDRWVVRKTLRTIAASPELLRDPTVRFAINLSGQSLGSEPFLGFVQEQISESGVSPSMLCFEITETVAVANIQKAQSFMHALKKIGCRFSLDDFGTGLSSFSYLKLFAVDTLKIDGSFIRDIATNVVSQSVVAALSEVARVMELETVAEYVEDEQALELLGNLGVTWAQGFLIGEPEPLEEQLKRIIPPVDAGQDQDGESAVSSERGSASAIHQI